MPSDRTTVTELGTGLGMLGLADIDEAVRSRTPVMHSLSPEMWERLARLRAGGAYDGEFHAAWANGQAFLGAADGLRGRLPNVVEWKGTGRARGTRWRPSTSASTTSTSSVASTCRTSCSTCRRPTSSTTCWSVALGGPAGRRGVCSPAAGTGTPRWRRRSTRRSTRSCVPRRSSRRAAWGRAGAALLRRRRPSPVGGRSPAAVALPGLDGGDAPAERAPPVRTVPPAPGGACPPVWGTFPRSRWT